MSVNIGTLEAVLRLRDEFTARMKAAETQMEASAKKWEAIGAKMTAVGGRLTGAVTLPILGVAAAAIKAGTDFVEAENLFEVSFGNMAQQARDWSEETGKALGLNRVDLRKNSATVFTMTESMGLARQAAYDMATGMTVLAGDMASFYNLNPQEAFDKLRSGIVGETEPLRRLGILVDENTIKTVAYKAGIAKLGAELTAAQKVSARYLAIQQQTVKAQGDLARTLDSPSNRMRALATRTQEVTTALGVALLPAFSKILDVLDHVSSAIEYIIEAFSGLPPPLQNAVIALAALAAALGPLLLIGGQLAFAWAGLAATFPAVAATIATAAGTVLTFITGPAGWIAAGAALLLAWKPLREKVFAFAAAVYDLGKAIVAVLISNLKEAIGYVKEAWEATATLRKFIAALAVVVKQDLGKAWEAIVKGFRAFITTQVEGWKGIAFGITLLARFSGALWLAQTFLKNLKQGMETFLRIIRTTMVDLEKMGRIGALAFSVLSALSPALGTVFLKSVEMGMRAAEEMRKVRVELIDVEAIAGEAAIAFDGLLGDKDGKEISKELQSALEAAQKTIAANRALAAAAADSSEAYERLNALLEQGFPLADALSGSYDRLGQTLLDTKLILESYVATRQAEAELANQQALIGRLEAGDLEGYRRLNETLAAGVPLVLANASAFAELGSKRVEVGRLAETVSALFNVLGGLAEEDALAKAFDEGVESYKKLEKLLQAGIPLAAALSGSFDWLAEKIEEAAEAAKIRSAVTAGREEVEQVVALTAALGQGNKQYERLNILLNLGVPLAKALSGQFNYLADNIRKAQEGLANSQALRAIEEQSKAAAALALVAKESYERFRVVNYLLGQGVPLAKALSGEYDAIALAALRIADHLEKVQAVQENFLRNLQDGFAEAFSEILNTRDLDLGGFFKKIGALAGEVIGATMAAELSKALQDAFELRPDTWKQFSQNMRGLLEGGAGLFNTAAFVGGAISGANSASYAAAGAAVGAAIGAAIGAAAAYYFTGGLTTAQGAALGAKWGAVIGSWVGSLINKGTPEFYGALQATAGKLTIGRSALGKGFQRVGEMFGTNLAEAMQRMLDTIGATLLEIAGGVDIKFKNDKLSVFLDGLEYRFTEDIEAGIAFALTEALKRAKLENAAATFVKILENTTAQTLEALADALEFGQWYERLRLGDVAADLQKVFNDFGAAIRRAVEYGLDLAPIHQWLADELGQYRNNILGIVETDEERIRRQAEAFNQWVTILRAEQEAKRADLLIQKARLEAEIEFLKVHAKLGQAEINLKFDLLDTELLLLRAEGQLLRTKLKMLDAVLAALAAVDAVLANLPDLITPEEIDKAILGTGRGGRAGEKQRREDDQKALRDVLDDAARSLLPEFERALAEINKKWDDAAKLAHGNAELLAEVNAMREEEIRILEERRQQDFNQSLKDFVESAGVPMAAALADINEQAQELLKGLGEVAESLGLSAHDMKWFFELIQNAAEELKNQEIQKGIGGLLSGMAGLITDDKLRNQLLMEAARIEFELRMAQYQMEFEFLKAIGALTAEQIALVDKSLGFLRDNSQAILDGMVAGGGGGGGGEGGGYPKNDWYERTYGNAGEKQNAALQRLRDIQEQAFDPLTRNLRAVVKDFTELRAALGNTAEVQAAYAQEVRRVLDQHLGTIRSMREDLDFRSDAPLRSIDQFKMAEDRLQEAVAALASGDLSQIDKIPDLADLVLELIPSSGAGGGRRRIFDWVKQILAEAEAAGVKAAEDLTGLQPHALDWLATEATAGDQMVTSAVFDAGERIVANLQIPAGSTAPPPHPTEEARHLRQIALLRDINNHTARTASEVHALGGSIFAVG